MVFVNDSGTVAYIYNAINVNITGSPFLTLLLIISFILLFFLAFRIPLEASAIFILPLLLTFAAFEGTLYAVVGAALIYLGVIWAKNWLI